MAEISRIQAAQQLRSVALTEREGKLIPVNEYKPDSFEYSATNPNALSDGDEKGKGETDTIGGKTDIQERIKLSVINQFAETKPYTSPE